jgi:Uma2 family endonuclease
VITLPDWLLLSPNGLTADDYAALPEEVCRRIEIIDGGVLVNIAPSRSHQRVVRHFANALDEAARPTMAVASSVDLRLRDMPLLNRRPDIVVYDASLSDDVILRPEHCTLVVEVMAPESITADKLNKPAQYAAFGVPHFWRVENLNDERGPTVFRYRLRPTAKTYTEVGVDSGKLVVTDPFPLSIDLADLY